MITHSGPVPVLGANKSHVSKPSAVNPVQDDEVEEITILDDDDEEPTPNPAGLATNSSSSLLTFFVKDHWFAWRKKPSFSDDFGHFHSLVSVLDP